MAGINQNYLKLPDSYLFSEIAARKRIYLEKNPGATIVNMGIGDVTKPLFKSVTDAMTAAVSEMSDSSTFRGYAPEQGYSFLREAIARNDYAARKCNISADEIFISDGSKSDCANITDIFSNDNIVAICDPVYPVYFDSNVMLGRTIVSMECNESGSFVPELPDKHVDIIYLCYPNNPTGEAITRESLKKWVDYANDNDAVILYDGAYEAYISTPGLPHSIYEIPGADRCAIEFRSFSKSAGFTGTRCAYTVVPKALKRQNVSLRDMWNRRQCTKFNGVPYIVQRGAEAVYSAEGRREQSEVIGYYKRNAAVLLDALKNNGITAYGGVDSPYIWIKLPEKIDSWTAFDMILNRQCIATTPGAGFGKMGEGYIRITAFGKYEEACVAGERIAEVLNI